MYPPKFSVGEIAIAIDPGGPFDGLECEIVQPLHQDQGIAFWRDPIRLDKGMMYGVRFRGEQRTILAFPHELRKRPPPTDELPVEAERELTTV